MIKTEMSFKKGLLVAFLIVLLFAGLGVLIGYTIGHNVAQSFYLERIAELKSNCIVLN